MDMLERLLKGGSLQLNKEDLLERQLSDIVREMEHIIKSFEYDSNKRKVCGPSRLRKAPNDVMRDDPVIVEIIIEDLKPDIDILSDENIMQFIKRRRGPKPQLKRAQKVNKLSLNKYIDRVIFADPRTIVLWKDGSKTIVTADEEKFDKEKGLLMAMYRKFYGKDYMKDLNAIIETATVAKKKTPAKKSADIKQPKPAKRKAKAVVRKTNKKGK